MNTNNRHRHRQSSFDELLRRLLALSGTPASDEVVEADLDLALEELEDAISSRRFHGAYEEMFVMAPRHLTVLHAYGHTATLRCERTPRDIVDTYAVLDSVVAGERWFLSSRLVWRQHDFAEVDAARVHDRVVIAAECGDAGLYRLTYDDVEGAAIRTAVRDLLLREFVLRPAFEDYLRSERSIAPPPDPRDIEDSTHG